MSTKQIYLDNAATTCLRESVITRIYDAMNDCFGNPSSTHSYGRNAKSNIEKARKNIARIINASPSEIIFTSGGTEADNIALQCAVRYLNVSTIITSSIEHHAVLNTVKELKKLNNLTVHYVNILDNGSIDLAHLEELLQNNNSNKLVSLMHVNNEIGNISDIKKISSLCNTYQSYFHSDTVQSIGHLPWDVSTLNIHFLTAAAHKFHGPKGIGLLYVNKNIKIAPLILGGNQERGLRAGTECIHNILGLEEAMICSYENLSAESKKILKIKQYFIAQLEKHLPQKYIFNGLSGDSEKSIYTLVNVRFIDIPTNKIPMFQFHLDIKGIACSKGSACQSGSDKGSHVLSSFLTKEQTKDPSVRFSFSSYNTSQDIDYLIDCLLQFYNE